MSRAFRQRLGRSGARRLLPPRPLAPRVGLARRRRYDRDPGRTRVRPSSNGRTCTVLPTTATLEDAVDGYPRQVWLNATGEEVIESDDPGHGAWDAARCRTGQRPVRRGRSVSPRCRHLVILPHREILGSRRPPVGCRGKGRQSSNLADPRPVASTATRTKEKPDLVRPSPVAASPQDIGAIIANALKAAGLMKAN